MTSQPGLDPNSALEVAEQGPGGGEALDASYQFGSAGKSPVKIAMRRLRKDKIAMISLGVIVFFLLMGVFAPVLAHLEGQDPYTPNPQLLNANGLPDFYFNSQHWFGIEPGRGRDLFARFVYGVRPSLIIAISASVVTTIVGTVAGLIAGYFGGWIDAVIGWLIDFVLSLPFLVFAIALVPVVSTYFGTPDQISATQREEIGFGSLIFVLIFFFWSGLARLIRGEVLGLREREFVQAARALGVPTRRILFREILPNLTSVILVSLTLAIPAFVGAEAGLAYLGVGIADPTPDWGLTISQSQSYFQLDPVWLWIPLGGVVLLVLSLSLLGDAVSDAFNPNTRR
ncbi:MAG: ABC transporter permease [Actinomycetota bacterium]|nr:ABC transporter permease [Actinomycetota bacterium]